jgi:hypothetical protein
VAAEVDQIMLGAVQRAIGRFERELLAAHKRDLPATILQ